MLKFREGGCRCGAIRYQIVGEAIAGIACHCRDCQLVAGGSPNLTWVFKTSGFSVTHGSPRIYKATAQSGGSCFCGVCGVHVFSIPDSNTQLVAIKVGSFDDATGFHVDADIWMNSAPPWHHLHDGAAQFEKNPPDQG